MPEIVAAHLERVASELARDLEKRGFFSSETFRAEVEPVLAAALAACAREASEKLKPYCRHLNSCAAFPARSEQQIERDCDCGLIKALRALERAAGENLPTVEAVDLKGESI